MNPCKECIVDMICIKECPMFEVDLNRIQTDEQIYLQRCMNNVENGTSYEILKGIQIIINKLYIIWLKDENRNRDNDKPCVIFYSGTRCWYKNDKRHRDNDKPAIVYARGSKRWYKNGECYDPM